ncbi:MAG: hypothetical protein ACE5ET_03355 [Gammaproteobacteria bacterium]
MIEISTEFNEEIPKWDVALEALVKEEFQRLGRPLDNADFRRLANQYAIRFDDIMATLFELAIAQCWEYLEMGGGCREITRDLVERLYVNGRLDERDLRDFSGGWRPCH